MRKFVLFVLPTLAILPAFTQTVKPVAGKKQQTVSTPKPRAERAPTPKPSSTPKSGSTGRKTGDAAKPRSNTSAKAAKPPAEQAARSTPKPTATPKATATPKPKITEDEAWVNATAIEDPAASVKAIRKFLADFPKSEKRVEAISLLVSIQCGVGDASLRSGDRQGAVRQYMSALTDAGKPMPQEIFTEYLSKLAGRLFFAGEREGAMNFAKALEAQADPSQLLAIATFYLTIENGGEAKRVAERSIAAAQTAAAYHVLGLARRLDFEPERSAEAFAKSLEIDPSYKAAKLGLAEAKRSIGEPEAAIELYRGILTTDAEDVPARTGLVLALFDSGKREEAEAEMNASLAANRGNSVLLAGAAYWYAASGDFEKAIDTARQAVAAQPRYIWGHIALARGLMGKGEPVEAERVLLAARRFGDFPALRYEIASARAAAGFYRDAAEELATVFSIEDGKVWADLGWRVERSADEIEDLVAQERRASIFTPKAADDEATAKTLRSLLEFSTELMADAPDAERIAAAGSRFASAGDSRMAVHRELFAASQMLSRKVAPEAALNLVQKAAAASEKAFDAADPSAAIMADELYSSRTAALANNEFIRIPTIPKATLTAILRGRIEELAGWSLMEMGRPSEASTRLRRAVSVLPAESAWWRSATWRLGMAYEAEGKAEDALKALAASYKSSGPDPARYRTIKDLYQKVKGSLDGLDALIGPEPAPAAKETDTGAAAAKPAEAPTSIAGDSPTANPKQEQTDTIVAAPPVEVRKDKSESSASVSTDSSGDANRGTTPPVAAPVPSAEPKQEKAGPARPRVVQESSAPPQTCSLSTNESVLNLNRSVDLAVVVRADEEIDLAELEATVSDEDIEIRREVIRGILGRALYVVRSRSGVSGRHTVKFSLPCGSTEIVVNVR